MPQLIHRFINIGQCLLNQTNGFRVKVINYKTINERFLCSVVEGQNKIDEIDEEHDWNDEPPDKVKLPQALDTCTEDISQYVARFIEPGYNFAKYANKSPMIQELVKLGVELYRLEEKPKATRFLLGKNFKDMKPYIQFLYDCGVPAEKLGKSITINPFIFGEDLDDLRTRIRFLRAHNFSRSDIATIVSNNAIWLMFSTIQIDEKLAYFQREFKLTGNETRKLAVSAPRLITRDKMKVSKSTFCFKHEMGFDFHEVKLILFIKPQLWLIDDQLILRSFDYVHNGMKISHERIANMPEILHYHFEHLRNRHEFLKLIGRAQYDPLKPLYVSLDNVCLGDDREFCQNIAKAPIELFNMFLKTQ